MFSLKSRLVPFYFVAYFIAGLYWNLGLGQESSPTPLRLDKTIPVPAVTGGAIVNPIKCDGRGNIYFRMDHPRVFATPVIKLSADGEKKAVFTTENVTGWEDADVYDFAAHPGGDTFLLGARLGKGRKIEHAVLSFTEKGKFRDSISLDFEFTSTEMLAAFSTGEFLVVGWKKATARESSSETRSAGKEPEVEAHTVVFDRNGNALQRIELFADLPMGNASAGSTRSPLLLPASAISLGSSTAGDSGEVFVMFRGNTPTVFAVAPKSNVIRKIEILPPTNTAVALNIGYASGWGLVVQFAEKTNRDSFNTARSIISIVDTQTGRRLYDYQPSPDTGGAFACRSPGGFLFLTTLKDGFLGIRRSVPR